MTGLGLALAAIGLADLVAGGISGEPKSVRRIGFGLLVAGLIGVVTGFSRLIGWGSGVVLIALVLIGSSAWLWLRYNASGSTARAAAALGSLSGMLAVIFALSSMWADPAPAWLSQWLSDLPFDVVQRIEPPRLLLLLGLSIFMIATGNGIVRCVLDAAGSDMARSEQRLRGGRVIGIFERLLIFGLAVSGEPTAAALIVSAKSILRFPELSRVARDDPGQAVVDEPDQGPVVSDAVREVDVVTEYFLLGSLTSWLIALAAVPLVVG